MWFTSLLSGLQAKIIAGLVVLLLALSGGVYWYKSSMDVKVDKLEQEITLAKVQISEYDKIIKNTEAKWKQANELTKKAIESERAAVEQAKALDEKLSKLDKAARAKPGLVETIINKASKERNRCFELATGAKPLATEKPNTTCPQLFKK